MIVKEWKFIIMNNKYKEKLLQLSERDRESNKSEHCDQMIMTNDNEYMTNEYVTNEYMIN